MRLARRLMAVAMQLALVGVTAASGGLVCPMQGMAGDMAGMSVTVPAPAQPPCSLPWAPANCHTIAPCPPAVLTTAIGHLRPPALAPAGVAAVSARPPRSRIIAPEPPPPRA